MQNCLRTAITRVTSTTQCVTSTTAPLINTAASRPIGTQGMTITMTMTKTDTRGRPNVSINTTGTRITGIVIARTRSRGTTVAATRVAVARRSLEVVSGSAGRHKVKVSETHRVGVAVTGAAVLIGRQVNHWATTVGRALTTCQLC